MSQNQKDERIHNILIQLGHAANPPPGMEDDIREFLRIQDGRAQPFLIQGQDYEDFLLWENANMLRDNVILADELFNEQLSAACDRFSAACDRSVSHVPQNEEEFVGVLAAWKDGSSVQFRLAGDKTWTDWKAGSETDSPVKQDFITWRIKPSSN